MIAIKDLINSTVDIIKEKIEEKDETYIQNLAQEQVDFGVDIKNVNVGSFDQGETEIFIWFANTVQKQIDKSPALDNPNDETFKKAAEVHENYFLINPIIAELERYNEVLAIVK